MINRLILLFLVLASSAKTTNASEIQLLEDLPPYSIIVYCLGSEEHYDIKIATFNQYGQIMLLGLISTIENGKPWIKIGEKMTSGLAAKIISHGEGKITWDFIQTTSGSSVIVIGEKGNVYDFEKLPLGFHKTINQPGYLLMGKIRALSDLPIEEKTLKTWVDPTVIERMISDGKITFN